MICIVSTKKIGEREKKMTKLSLPILSHIPLVAIVHYIDVLDHIATEIVFS